MAKKKEVNASLLRRFLSFLIDLIIVNFVIFYPFYMIILRKLPVSGADLIAALDSNKQISTTFTVVAFLVGILTLCYFMFCQYLIGQTPGMIFMNIKVVPLNDHRLTLFRSLIRNAWFIPLTPFSFLFIIDPIFLIFSKDNQRLTEWLSSTKVINANE